MKLYLAQLWAVAWKDLMVECRSRERVGAMAGFTVLVGVLFNYAIDPTLVRPEDIASGLVWLTIVFAGTLGLGRTFELEAQDGAFQGVLMTPAPRDALFLGKVLSNYVILLVVVFIVLAFAWSGVVTEQTLWQTAFLTPLFLAFLWLGSRLYPLASDRTFRIVAYTLMLLSGVIAIVG